MSPGPVTQPGKGGGLMLAILDYGAGNQTSVLRALQRLGIAAQITADAGKIADSEGVIFPGVGAASQAMERLGQSGLDAELARVVERHQPLLGICLGCQILLDNSEEGPTRTLGLVKGECRRFDSAWKEENGENIKIPHMGWNAIEIMRPSPLLADVPLDAEFYFVHGYYALPEKSLLIAKSHYGIDFCAVYGREALWAVQFHPEKSGEPGLRILKNFYDYCREKSGAI